MSIKLLTRPYLVINAITTRCCRHFSQRWNSDNVLRQIELRNEKHQSMVAIKDTNGCYTYNTIFKASRQLAQQMQTISGTDLRGARVSFVASNDAYSLVALLGLWYNGSIGVPLCSSHPTVEKQYYVEDSQASLIIGSSADAEEVEQLCMVSHAKSLIMPEIGSSANEGIAENYTEEKENRALIIYTSGTTGRPKGVVLSHTNVWSTMVDMIQSWEWTSSDVCLHSLPLHHIHGLVNALLVPLASGASVHMLPRFTAKDFWQSLLNSENSISVVTAVPTMYAKLLEYHNSQSQISDVQVRDACERIRVLISGSSGLPLPLYKSWHELTGHKLLERYGMTEILMAVTNALHGDRITGTIGLPFPSVRTIIAREDPSETHGYVNVTHNIDDTGCSEVGELYVKGPTVFGEYWNRPEATRDTFTEDGWFKTGDTMQIDNGYYKILGRTSVDIIKSGGYKLSALDIESKILLHPDIKECVVIGKPDLVYGQTVAVVLSATTEITIEDLVEWSSSRMAKYQIPRTVIQLEAIPRNAMGKVNKKSLISQYFHEQS